MEIVAVWFPRSHFHPSHLLDRRSFREDYTTMAERAPRQCIVEERVRVGTATMGRRCEQPTAGASEYCAHHERPCAYVVIRPFVFPLGENLLLLFRCTLLPQRWGGCFPFFHHHHRGKCTPGWNIETIPPGHRVDTPHSLYTSWTRVASYSSSGGRRRKVLGEV